MLFRCDSRIQSSSDLDFCYNKLVTYHSWFACPLLDLQADSRTWVRNGGAPLMPPRYLHLDLPKHVMRNVSRFHLRAHHESMILSQWNPPSGAVGIATVTSVPVLLFKMRCMFFFTVKTCLCALSEEVLFPFLPFLPILFYGGPLYSTCLA